MTKTRAFDWFSQAEDDFRWASDSSKAGHFAQACFACQQVAEKALKALALARGALLVKGHSTFKIAQALGVNAEIQEASKKLDLYYITARYPDAFPEGRPSEFLTRDDAEEALKLSETVLRILRSEIHE